MSTSFLGVKSVKNSVKADLVAESIIRRKTQAEIIEAALALYIASRHAERGLTAKDSEKIREELRALGG